MILETERLYLRGLEQGDFGALCGILQDAQTMTAYEGAFSDAEVLEIGYLFNRAWWHNGYAIEAARACKAYAFDALGAREVCSIIRDTNEASKKVAVRNGMRPLDCWVKHFRGVAMPHTRYVVRKTDERKAKSWQESLL